MARVVEANDAAIDEAAAIIRRGGLVAFPTETVYGLGADALDEAAARRIFEAKGRPANDPLIVHLAAADELARVAAARPLWLEALAARFWPGPLTLVVPRGSAVPLVVTAGRETVAVRVPAHLVAHALIVRAGTPIAAPSANPFGRPSPTRAEHVVSDLGDRVDLILDGGPTLVGVESTVLDLTGDRPRVLRPGGVTAEQLREVLGSELELTRPSVDDPRSPGTMRRHYSPRARVDLLADPSRLRAHAAALLARGERVGVLAFDEDESPPGALVERLGPEATPEVAAVRLYAALRALDAGGVDAIVARLPPAAGLGAALRDRLTRAADGAVL